MSLFGALLSDGILQGAAALIARGNFTDAEKIIINDTFVKLDADDMLQHMISAKVYGVSTEANSFLDWFRDDGAWDAVKVGSPVFTAYEGWTGTGSNADYIRSGFNPNGNISINNVIAAAWELSDSAQSNVLFGCQDGANEGISLIPKTSDAVLTRLNSDGNDSAAHVGAPVGYWSIDRKASTSYTVRVQNIFKASHLKSSTVVPNLEIWNLLSNNNGSPSAAGTRQIGAFLIASGSGNYNLITDAFNDAVVRLNALID